MRTFVTILILVAGTNAFAGIDICKKALVGTSLVVQGAYRVSDQVLKAEDLNRLSDREKAIYAKAVDFAGSHDPQRAVELLSLGADKESVAGILTKQVSSDLSVLESEGPKLRIFNGGQRLIGSEPSKPRPESLSEFSNVYELHSERATLSGVVGYHSVFEHGIRPEKVMKAALMTKDRDLILRSFRQALKYGHFNELTAMAAASKENAALIDLGRLSISRYLFFDRNINWLRNGLRSFAEVEGSDSEVIRKMLFDLYDLLRSPAILANEQEVNTYGAKGDLANYEDAALEVLIATLPIQRRLYGDSSARFVYLYQTTNDPQYTRRVEAQLNDSINRKQNIGIFAPAVSQIQDSEVLLRIAHRSEEYSRRSPTGFDEFDKNLYVHGAMRLAAVAFSMSADLKEIEAYLKRALEDSRFSERNRPFGGPNSERSLLTPKPVVDVYRAHASKPEFTTMAKWLETYDYYLGTAGVEVSATSKIFFEPSFHHEESSIGIFLKEGENASEEKIREFKKTGENLLQTGEFWNAMVAFISARDLDGLEKTYALMMTKGRPLDAVYAALAMEWIRTGNSPFDSDRLAPSAEPALLEGKARSVVDIQGDFDPKEAWRQSGHDPEKISVQIQNYPNGMGIDATPALSVSVFYDGKMMGEVDMYSTSDTNWGTYSALEADFKGKKVGALLYLIGAEIMFRLYPEAQVFESWDGSVDANYMWEKLVRSGRASKILQDDQVRWLYQMKPHHINDKLHQYIGSLKGQASK